MAERLQEDREWMALANCHGIPTEMFFPESNENINPYVTRVCNNCEVQKQCYFYAIVHNEVGVWGGRRFNFHNSSST